jgi:ADP-sugar diphosphatase
MSENQSTQIPAAAAATLPSATVAPPVFTAEGGISLDTAVQSKQFQNWLAQVDTNKFQIRSVHFQSVDMFGSVKVGFIKFKADVVDKAGKFIPGIVFMRGGSVGILAVLNCQGKKYSVMTVQPRVPTGRFDFLEIPAGMLDGSGNFAGVAAKELEEELGIKIAEKDLTDLSGLAGCNQGIYLSPGASDETMRFFSFTRDVTEEEMASMNGRCTGLISEGEQITLKIVPLDDLVTVADAKTIVAYALYQKYLAD